MKMKQANAAASSYRKIKQETQVVDNARTDLCSKREKEITEQLWSNSRYRQKEKTSFIQQWKKSRESSGKIVRNSQSKDTKTAAHIVTEAPVSNALKKIQP